MFADWERNWGLPDPCFFGTQQSLADRRRILMLKMTLLGGQSREFFVKIMSWLGYEIQIKEYAPYMWVHPVPPSRRNRTNPLRLGA